MAAAGVKQMAQRFIVGEDAKDALPKITKLWRDGVDTTVDLLGEATVTEAEADRYMLRCEDALRTLAKAATHANQVNLSVKVSALTPLLRPEAPERGIEGAQPGDRRREARVQRGDGVRLGEGGQDHASSGSASTWSIPCAVMRTVRPWLPLFRTKPWSS